MLLERLQLSFETDKPETDEAALPNEAPASTAERLSVEKARAVALRHPGALIIGSDQVAYLGTEVFGKPSTAENAMRQLQRMRGETVVFHTALTLLNTRSGATQTIGVPTHARFRLLSDEEIQRYVEKERPLDCAGSAKSEGLGISLLEAMSGDDPTALIGLPLIALCRMLRNEGIAIP